MGRAPGRDEIDGSGGRGGVAGAVSQERGVETEGRGGVALDGGAAGGEGLVGGGDERGWVVGGVRGGGVE